MKLFQFSEIQTKGLTHKQSEYQREENIPYDHTIQMLGQATCPCDIRKIRKSPLQPKDKQLRIMQIQENVIHRGQRLRGITACEINIIFYSSHNTKTKFNNCFIIHLKYF